MRRLLLGLMTALSWSVAFALFAQGAEPHLVLVANAQSAISRLAADDARKLYLGAPYLADGQEIKPLRNNADPFLQEVFMQKVMFMATPIYERQILSRVVRTGKGRPPVYTDTHELIDALKADRMAITYMTREAASAMPELKIVGELW